MQIRKHIKTSGVVVVWILLAESLYGQATGRLLGTVADTSGAVIPGATVTVVSQGTEASRVTLTDDTGRYLIPLLPVGSYTIRVGFTGFQEAVQKDVVLQTDESHEVNFTLAPVGVTQQVQVVANPIAVTTTNPTLGQVINSEQVADLPLNGRNFTQLASLVAGATRSTNPFTQVGGGPGNETSIRGGYSLSVGGSRDNSTDWLLDGIDNNELTAGAIAILPSIDAIREFKVLTYNYSAQYGTRGGPTVLVTIKSGINEFHGSMFEFFRNTVLNARSFFAPSREKFNQNQFGGSLGGPIWKDKTFFLADYQEQRRRRGTTFQAQVPTLLMQQGNFTESFPSFPAVQIFNPFSTRTVAGQLVRDPFMCDSSGKPLPTNSNGTQPAGTPCNIIPPSLIDPIAGQMIKFFPQPNVPGTLAGDFVSSPVTTLNDKEFDFRVDHNFSTKDSLFVRFSYDQATSLEPSGLPGFGTGPGGFASSETFADHGRNAAISETHVFSPNSVNVFAFGYNRIFNFITSLGDGSNESTKLGIPGSDLGPVANGLVDTTFNGGFWGIGDNAFAPFQGGSSIYHIADSFDLIRGAHDITVGGEVRKMQTNTLAVGFQDGFWFFNNLYTAGFTGGTFDSSTGSPIASFLLGLPNLVLDNQIFQGTIRGTRRREYRPYIQDNWKVRKDLTLNLGLAYNITTPAVESHNRQTNFDPVTGNFLIAGVNSGSATGVNTYFGGLEPRIGFAWSPRYDRNWAIRGGYAIFHDSGWDLGAQNLWLNPPFVTAPTFFADNISPSTTFTPEQGFPVGAEPTNPSQFVGESLNLTPFHPHTGTVQQFNLNVQRQLPREFLLTVGYTHSLSAHLLTSNLNLNTPPPNTPVLLPPFPQFGSINCFCDRGSARYDGLQIKVETKSTRRGLYMLLDYTYSKGFDNGFADFQ